MPVIRRASRSLAVESAQLPSVSKRNPVETDAPHRPTGSRRSAMDNPLNLSQMRDYRAGDSGGLRILPGFQKRLEQIALPSRQAWVRRRGSPGGSGSVGPDVGRKE